MVNHDSSHTKGKRGESGTPPNGGAGSGMAVLTKTFWVVGILLAVAGCGDSSAEETTTTTIAFTSTSESNTTTTTTTLAETTTTTLAVKQSATATIYRVQLDLKALDLFDGQVDGIAGEETQEALKAFQTQQGIPADGEFGPQTDSKLTPLLIANTAYVEELQERLTKIGVYTSKVDGVYGKGTKAAVEKVQASCEIEKTGMINIATRICIDQA